MPTPIEKQAYELERQRTADRLATGHGPQLPTLMARACVVEAFNRQISRPDQRIVTIGDVYIVTFAYILGGWKAMVSSDAWDDTSYFEVTHNVIKRETYVDHYRKVRNIAFPDGDPDVSKHIHHDEEA